MSAHHGQRERPGAARPDADRGVSAGFLLPEQFVAGLLDEALERESIRPRCVVLPMDGLTLSAPGFDYTDGTSGKRAGLQLQWTAESSTLNEQQGKARAIGFKA